MRITFALLWLLSCEEPCEEYTEEQFWEDLAAIECERLSRCGTGEGATCEEGLRYVAEERAHYEDCGATFNPCAAKDLIESLPDNCGYPSDLRNEVYTPKCPQDTAR